MVQLNSLSDLFTKQWPLAEHGKRKGPQSMNSELSHGSDPRTQEEEEEEEEEKEEDLLETISKWA